MFTKVTCGTPQNLVLVLASSVLFLGCQNKPLELPKPSSQLIEVKIDGTKVSIDKIKLEKGSRDFEIALKLSKEVDASRRVGVVELVTPGTDTLNVWQSGTFEIKQGKNNVDQIKHTLDVPEFEGEAFLRYLISDKTVVKIPCHM